MEVDLVLLAMGFTGPVRHGLSLVVHAIAEGRQAAREIDRWLRGKTSLP